MVKLQSRKSHSNSIVVPRAVVASLFLLLLVGLLYMIADEPVPTTVFGTDQLRTSTTVECKDKITSDASVPSSGVSTTVAIDRDFLEIAKTTGTDKVLGHINLPGCVKDREHNCISKEAEREACRPYGHFYDTIYNHWLKKWSTDNAEPIQFLEVGFSNGRGYDAYSKFLPRAEIHSVEINCIPTWPHPNLASEHHQYQSLRDSKRLHCGDANDYDFLHEIWTKMMKRPDAPPLKVVIDDASHLAAHKATSFSFGFLALNRVVC
jgi:hypothetical protein